MMHTEQQKNEYLLNLFDQVHKITEKEEVFNRNGGRVYYSDSHRDEVGKSIESQIQGATYSCGVLKVVTDYGAYSFLLQNAKELAEDLKKELAINWQKTTHDEDKNILRPLYRNGGLPKGYLFEFKDRELAECFDSKEQFNNDTDHVNARHNLEQAKQALANIEANAQGMPWYKEHVKKAKGMVNLWQSYVDKWDAAAKIEVDYKDVIRVKEHRKLEQEANSNEHIKTLAAGTSVYLAKVEILKLFRKYDVEPTSDVTVFTCLLYAEEINDRDGAHYRKWQNNFGPLEKWMHHHVIELKDRELSIQETYFKKNGQLKALSYGARSRYHSEHARAEQLKAKINFVKEHTKTISEFIH